MSAANPNPMDESMVSVLVVANAGGGSPLPCGPPPCEMPPKHRQLRAPCPKASGNAFQAPVDPPNDGNNLSFDGGDDNTDGSDDNTIVTAPPCDSGPPASPNTPNKCIAIQQWLQAMQDGLMHSCPPEAPAEPGVPELLHLSVATHLVLIAIRDGLID
jgi:hypothetical protein